MQRVHRYSCAAAVAATMVAGTGLAAQTRPQTSGAQNPAATQSQVSSDDMAFAQKAAEGGMKEVEQGRMVASKASNAQVKAYANRLVKDHSAANRQLMAIAKRKHITLPSEAQGKPGTGSVGARNDATTATKTGTGRPDAPGGNPTGTTGASNRVETTGEVRGQGEAWMSLSGAAFDKGFIDAAVEDHQKDITEFEQEAKNGRDAELKAFASKTLPTLRAHLKQAQDLQSKLGKTSE